MVVCIEVLQSTGESGIRQEKVCQKMIVLLFILSAHVKKSIDNDSTQDIHDITHNSLM